MICFIINNMVRTNGLRVPKQRHQQNYYYSSLTESFVIFFFLPYRKSREKKDTHTHIHSHEEHTYIFIDNPVHPSSFTNFYI